MLATLVAVVLCLAGSVFGAWLGLGAGNLARRLMDSSLLSFRLGAEHGPSAKDRARAARQLRRYEDQAYVVPVLRIMAFLWFAFTGGVLGFQAARSLGLWGAT